MLTTITKVALLLLVACTAPEDAIPESVSDEDAAIPDPGPAPAEAVVPAGRYALIDVYQRFGNGTTQPHHGPWPDNPPTNERRWLTPNTGFQSVYRQVVNARAGDVLLVTGMVLASADANSYWYQVYRAEQCANYLYPRGLLAYSWADAPRDAATGIIKLDAVNSILAICNATTGAPRDNFLATYHSVSPVRTSLQLVSQGQLVGNRVAQRHGRSAVIEDCVVDTQICHGHMYLSTAGVIVATEDGPKTIDLQVAAAADPSIKLVMVESGGGQIVVEHYRRISSILPSETSYGLVDLRMSTTEHASIIISGGEPGHEGQNVEQQIARTRIYELNQPVASGDVVRVFGQGVGSSPWQTYDAVALGLYAWNGTTHRDIRKAWAVDAFSTPYPYGKVSTDAVLRPTVAETLTLKATMHGSNFNAYVAAHGSGLVKVGGGHIAAMRYRPITSGGSYRLLSKLEEIRTSNGLRSSVPADGQWHQLYAKAISMPGGGFIRALGHAQILHATNRVGEKTECATRLSLPSVQTGSTNRAVLSWHKHLVELRAEVFATLPANTTSGLFWFINCKSNLATGYSNVTVDPTGSSLLVSTFD